MDEKKRIVSFLDLDVYRSTEVEFCTKLIDAYDKAGRQLYKLGLAWSNFKERRQT